MNYLIILLLAFIKVIVGDELFLSQISGKVSKGNFSYHSMNYEGTILVELITVSGDSDLYISEKTLLPTYEPESNSLQSATCGVDTVIVPKSYKRPIGIGIFGHPFHETSSFHLMFYEIDDSQDLFHYNPYAESINNIKNKKHKYLDSDDNLDDPFLRLVFKFILKAIIEIIL